jgi:threonine synthase
MSATDDKLRLSCVRCHREYQWSLTLTCEGCGALVDVDYDLAKARIGRSGPPLERYFDLLPLRSRDNIIDGGEGNTPCLHAVELGRAVGLDRLYVKVEGANPTRTTKDRQGSMAVATFRDLGVSRFVTSSTGNSCTSLARIVSRFPDMHMSIFVGDEFLSRVNWVGAKNVTVYWLKDGTFVDAHHASRWFSEQSGAVAERGFFFFGKREALKVAYLEAVEQIPTPITCYVQGISSAMGVYSTYKAAQQLHGLGRITRLPRLVCVQEETCNPMVRAWERGADVMSAEDVIARPRGLSKSTLRGDSRMVYSYVRQAVLESGGIMLTAAQDAMREMRALALATEGLDICHTSAMTIVAARELARRGWLERDATVMLNLTGADRTGEPHAPADYIVERDGEGWRATPARGGERGMAERVIGVLVKSLGLPSDTMLDADTRLVGGGLALDSIRVLELSLALEEAFGCQMQAADVKGGAFETVGTLADLFRRKLADDGASD